MICKELVASYTWTAIPTMVHKIGSEVRRRKLREREKIIIACGETRAIALFSRDYSKFQENLVSALREINYLMRPTVQQSLFSIIAG